MKEANSYSILTPKDPSVLPQIQREAITRIQKWVQMICRNRCNETNQIYVSPLEYKNGSNELKNKTIIAVSGNLPDGPIIQIPKKIEEVSLEDLLKNYKLINYCRPDEQKKSS